MMEFETLHENDYLAFIQLEEEGARPWWKWFALAVGVVDEAKEEEPRLPKPEEVKRIEPPKKQISNRNRPDMDDDIPF